MRKIANGQTTSYHRCSAQHVFKWPDPFGPPNTFATTGKVSSVDVDASPFADTAVGACIANKFRGVRIPAFEGGAVTVGKSFVLR